MPEKIAFFSVTYPGMLPFLGDFLDSLRAQTHCTFDLVLFDDGAGLSKMDLGNSLAQRTFVIQASGPPSRVRREGLQWLTDHNYQIVVFGDSDDIFSANRVESAETFLQETDIQVCDLRIVDSGRQLLKDKYLSQRIMDKAPLQYADIRYKNFFGLSNTALRLQKFPVPDFFESLVAVDWYLFSDLLKKGARARFSASCYTEYRQHASNSAGILNMETPLSIEKSLKIAERHYQCFSDQYPEERLTLCQIRKLIHEFEQGGRSKVQEFQNFVRKIKHPFWWEVISKGEKYE